MFKGFDTTDALPKASILKSAGMSFAIKYCSLGAYPHKELTDAEIADCHAHGIACGFIWERFNTLDHFSASEGTANATAQVIYMAKRKVPGGTGICAFHAIDFDPILPGNDPFADVDKYIVPYCENAQKIVKSDGYLLGGYGPIAVLARLKALGLIHYTWRPNAKAWSGYNDPFAIDIDQQLGNVLGLSSDPDTATNLAWAWRP